MRYKIDLRSLEISHLQTVYEMGKEIIEPQSLASFDWTPEMLAKAYTKNENLQLGAFAKKKLVGYLIALQLEENGPVKILGIGVAKDFRNKEVKRNHKENEEIEFSLLARLVELLKGRCSCLHIVETECILSLYKIFEKIGFTRTGSISEMKMTF